MDLLYEAAKDYSELLDKDYHITAVYKDEVIELSFYFLPEHFYHLIGFHKLLYDLVDESYAHLFLRRDEKYGYVPCSFFCRSDDRYIRNNKKYRVKSFSVTARG